MSGADFRALCGELLAALENAIRVIYNEDGTQHISTADDVIARADAALAAEPAPAPEGGPSIEELAAIYYEHIRGCDFMDQGGFEDAARDVLARYGTPAPVPVAERLPGEGDCDKSGYFWCCLADDREWLWMNIGAMNWEYRDRHGYTHWLPHWALPLPSSQPEQA